MMRTIFAIILIGFFLISCSSDEPKHCCTVVSIGISVKYLNQDGENLLEIENGIRESDMRVYHKIENEWVISSGGIQTIERKDGTYVQFAASIEVVKNNISESKIVLSEEDEDIIETELNLSPPNTLVTKVWYEGELKWDTSGNERIFEIIK